MLCRHKYSANLIKLQLNSHRQIPHNSFVAAAGKTELSFNNQNNSEMNNYDKNECGKTCNTS